MFCCTPQHLELSIAKNQFYFEYQQLNPKKFTQIIKNKSTKHKLTKNSSLQVDQKLNYQLKIGHEKHSQLLFQVCDVSKQIYLTNIDKKIHDQKLWRVLGQKQSHQLRLGDIIKLGYSELLVYGYNLFYQQEKESVQFKSQYNCRYCFTNTYTNADPLLNMCKCSGSVKYLHLHCLRSWLMMKFQQQRKDRIVLYMQLTKLYRTNKLECEICKTQWPRQVQVNGKTVSLLDFQTNQSVSSDSFFINSGPYVVLETEGLNQDEIYIKIFMKIYLDSHFYFGDNYDSADLALQTYGVSSLHSCLYLQNNQIYIADCGSMAGTLVTMHEQQLFTNKKSLYLQYGQLLLNISLEQPLFWCFTPQQQYKLKYRIQNQYRK